MGDFLLMHLCGNLLEVGHSQMGVGDVGRFLLLACMDGSLTICEKCIFLFTYWKSQTLFFMPLSDWANRTVFPAGMFLVW